jgi:hypothetical protein
VALLGDLLVKIGVDADGVEASLGKVDGLFQRHAGKIAAAGAAIGAGGAAALGQGLQSGLEREALGDKLAAQLGATGPEAQRFGKIAGNLYSEAFGEDLGQVSNAVDAVVSSIDGMRTASNQAVQDMTAKVLNLAQAFEVDVGRSAQVVGQIVKSGLVKDAAQGMDLITASFQRVPAAVREDLLDALDEYSPFLTQIGIKGQNAFNLLVQAADKGAFGLDKTGDALKEFTLRATDMSTGSKAAYDAIGLSQKKMTAELLAGGDRGARAFQKIVTGLRNIKDPVKQSQAALALFGTPLEDLSTKDIPKFLSTLDTTKNTLGDTKGAADELGKTLSDNAATGIESWRRKTDQMLAGMANAPGVFGDTAQAAAGIGSVLAPIGSDLGGLAAAALVGGKAFGPLASGVARGAAAIGTASASVVASGARMVASMTATAARVVAGWALIGAQALLNAAKVALSWMIAFAPAIAVIALVALIVVMIIKHWDTIKQKTQAAWSWIVGKIKAAGRGVLAAVNGLGSIPGKISGYFERAKTGAISKANQLVAWMKRLPGRIRSGLGNLGNLLYNAGMAIPRGLWNGIKAMGGWLRDQIMGWVRSVVPGPVLRFLGISSPSKLFAGYGVNIAEGLARGITSGAPLVERASSALGAAAAGGDGSGSAVARTPVPSGVRATAAGGGMIPIYIDIGGRRFVELLVDPLRNTIATKGGGDVQAYLGRS